MPDAPWRVVIVTRVLPVAIGFHRTLCAAGHEPVALLTIRDPENRYGDIPSVEKALREVPAELDVLIPARRAAIAPLLASVEPDLVVCMGFPWKVPADALAVPPLGWLNLHPSLLPLHRGPVPIAWAIRNGEKEIGLTAHRMDVELDTGPILAQRTLPLGEYVEPELFYPSMDQAVFEVFTEALEKLAAGDGGTVQEGGEYESFFTDDDAWLDLEQPAVDVHRLVWAWRYTVGVGTLHGALTTLDGETVRVLASSLTEVEGARRIECGDGPLWLVRIEPAEAQTAAGAVIAARPSA
jgi:methionyl-tRNA formyltransferase